MTVGFHSPLPPARTGVADYSVALLRALRRFGTVEIAPRQAGVRLYHLGNNQLHRAIYECALREPGVVVLHDAVLQHFFLGSLDEQRYIAEFTYNYGDWHLDTARDLYRRRAGSGADAQYFAYPMLRRIAESSRALIVHNAAAARMVREHAPGAHVIEIPHLFDPLALPTAAEALRFRQRLGISSCAFLFGVFGYLRESKRLPQILRAFAAARRERAAIHLLVAGDFASRDLERALEPLLAGPAIRRLPYLDERDFRLSASAVDACINLRYPAAGESSGIAVRLMGMGKPVMVTGGPEVAGFPEPACLRIEPGVAETSAIRDHMILVASFPQVAAEIGRRGAGHIAARHSAGRAAELYWKVLCEYGP